VPALRGVSLDQRQDHFRCADTGVFCFLSSGGVFMIAWLKKWFYKIMLIEKPLTRHEIDEIIKKAISDQWRKDFLKK